MKGAVEVVRIWSDGPVLECCRSWIVDGTIRRSKSVAPPAAFRTATRAR